MKVVHHVPGRLRLEVPELFSRAGLARSLAQGLTANRSGIIEADINPLTSRILIKYRPAELTLKQVLTLVNQGLNSMYYDVRCSMFECKKSPGSRRVLVRSDLSPHDETELVWGMKLAMGGDKMEGRSHGKPAATGELQGEHRRAVQSQAELYELERLPIGRQAFFTVASGLLLFYATATGDGRKGLPGVKQVAGLNTAFTVLSGYPIFRTAGEHLFKKGHLSTEFLGGVASVASLIVEDSRMGLFINFLIYLSTWLRTMAAEHTRDKIRVLLAGKQGMVRVMTGNGQVMLKQDRLRPGTTVIVAAGERLPVDGLVQQGRAVLRNQLAKGADMLVVGSGDQVLAGSTVTQGMITVAANKVGDQTYLGRVIGMLRQGTCHSAHWHAGVVRVMNGIALVALAAAGGVYLRTGDPRRAIAMLIAGAPGAAGLAASMALGTGVGVAANRGVLVKDDRHLETLGQVDAVMFNKGGVLSPWPQYDRETVALLQEAYVGRIGVFPDSSPPKVVNPATSKGAVSMGQTSDPRSKLNVIREMQKAGHKVAVVGDAQLDVVALAAADVGITAVSTEALNLESAHVVIVGHDPRRVAWAKLLANHSMAVARQNTMLTLGVNVISLALGVIGRLTPVRMAVLHNISTLGILLNSGRLLRPPEPRVHKFLRQTETAATSEVRGSERYCPGLEPQTSNMEHPSGLTRVEAQAGLQRYGHNVMPNRPQPTPIDIFRQQFQNPMSKVLLSIAGISMLLGKQSNAMMSGGVLVVNTLMAVVQERRTLHSLQMLDGLIPLKARVIRDGQLEEIPARLVVPGDVIVVEAGDKVPADARLFEAHQLVVEEASLTGESEPVVKEAGGGKPENYLYMGTGVLTGRAQAAVQRTGDNTEIGRIAGSINGTVKLHIPLHNRLDELAVGLVKAGLAVSGVSVLAGLWHQEDLSSIIANATNLAVSLIPDGLAPMITLTTALGALRLMKRQVVVRQLPAVDTTGCTSVICLDKTGTLTQNRMEMVEIFCGGEDWQIDEGGKGKMAEALARFWRVACLCNNAVLQPGSSHNGGYRADGDSTECALLVAAARSGFPVQQALAEFKRLEEIPFSSETMCMTVRGRDRQGKDWLYVKGAPDVVVNQCTAFERGGGIVPLTVQLKQDVLAQVREMSSRALRVLALAHEETGSDKPGKPPGARVPGLVLDGLAGIIDPPRPEAADFVKLCRQAGVKVILITGDHQETALAVARQTHIVEAGAAAITGAELDKMTGEELAGAVRQVQVYARTSPGHKLELIKALQKQGEIVTMVGDGVNDVPAMKKAHLGVAMGAGGTAVAREVAAVTLADDNIQGLGWAVAEGRTVYANIRQTMRYLMTTNMGDSLLILVAALMGCPLPVTSSQLLWANLTGDPLVSWRLANDQPRPDVMAVGPRRRDAGIFSGGLGRHIAGRSALLGLSALMVYGSALSRGEALNRVQTKTMAALSLGRILHLFDYRHGYRTSLNRGLTSGGAIMLLCLLGAVYVPFLRSFLKTAPLPLTDWLPVLGWSGAGSLVQSTLFRTRTVSRYRE